MIRRLILILLLVVPAFGQAAQDLADYQIVTFDKQLVGTDKLIYMYPPPGKTWTILQGSADIRDAEQPETPRVPHATFVLYLENAPYAPYRDPATGEMKGCQRCVTLMKSSTENQSFFPMKEVLPITVSYPNRLMAAVTPAHGGLEFPLQVWLRLQVVERDLPPPVTSSTGSSVGESAKLTPR